MAVAGPRVLLVAKRPLVERLGPTDTRRLATEPRIGPLPGWVMMSMNIKPCMPP